MKYCNAAERLPAQLLQELQRHAPGELLYIPAKQRQAWGEGSGAKTLYARRNAEIRGQYYDGQADVPALSDAYCLSDETVRKIIYTKGETSMNENEIDYSKYFWQNELVRLKSSRVDRPMPVSVFNSQQRFFNEGEQELPWDEKKWQERWETYVNSNKDGSSWVLVTVEALDGTEVGGGNLHCIDARNGTFGLFISVLPGHEGKGYEHAAGRLLLDYAFNERRLHTCCNSSYVGDAYGNAFYEGLGFKKEGVLRARTFHQGHYWDEIHYSLLAEEFNAQKATA